MVTSDHRRRFEAAIPNGHLTLCRLRANPDTIRRRIITRRQAEANAAGTSLTETALADLRAYGDSSVAFAEALESDDFADFTLDTNDTDSTTLAQSALTYGDWPTTTKRWSHPKNPTDQPPCAL